MQIRPLHDRVIIKRLAAETTTSFGIVIPDSAGEKPDQGEVIAVGPGKRDDAGRIISPDVKVGDRIAIHFGERTLAVEVLSVADNVGKADAAALYRELPNN